MGHWKGNTIAFYKYLNCGNLIVNLGCLIDTFNHLIYLPKNIN